MNECEAKLNIYGIYYYIMTKFDCVKHDSHLAAYGSIVLQWFEFIKVCMHEHNGFARKVRLFLYFVHKIYLVYPVALF